MKLHRFYLPDVELSHEFWMKDKNLFHQWVNVLRFQVDREVVLFNQNKLERLYKITKIGNDAVNLELVTELEPKLPKKNIYLCFSLLKKDKNDWVLQKSTELGVRHFMPLVCDRTEKTGFDSERAKKIVIEASEQCGRTDIPRIREPITPQTLFEELKDKAEIFIAEQGSPDLNVKSIDNENIAVLIGPEGGWSDAEKSFFAENGIKYLALNDFTLRAETAAITSVGLLGVF